MKSAMTILATWILLNPIFSKNSFIENNDDTTLITYQLITPATITKRESPAEYRYLKWEAAKYPDSSIDKRYVTYEKLILVKSAGNYFETIAPEFRMEIKEYQTQRPKKKRRKYKKITELVLIKPEHKIYIVSPPEFKNTFRKELVKEASEGVPEQHENHAFRELIKNGSYEEKLIPAEYLEVEHWVRKSKGSDD